LYGSVRKMPEQKERKYINVPVSHDEYEQLEQEAEAQGTGGKAPLLRLVAKRVRELGEGNIATGLAKLRLAEQDGLYFADSSQED
jgi:hypothetical protein